MSSVILSIQALGFPWVTQDPFLFCAYHNDNYPAGNAEFGPKTSLLGRQLGSDFTIRDGWRMYHGMQVPGFPAHPHRGFETVTVVQQGRVDHADSLGAKARYGDGDVQWLTAGRGIQHSEMFPLLRSDADNPLELFQIWLNLPAKDKMAEPNFTMYWSENISRYQVEKTKVTMVTGELGAYSASALPPPDSWAAKSHSDVVIAVFNLDSDADFYLPKANHSSAKRMLYFYQGDSLLINTEKVAKPCVIEIASDQEIRLQSEKSGCQLLLLQGVPLNEPVAQHGPFVMNTREEIMQAFADYRQTQFGGWIWDRPDPVHGNNPERFAETHNGKQTPPV